MNTMKFILAEKKEMTQKFAEDGTVIPVTKVVAGPCFVTQKKVANKDGYTAIQVGFGKKNKLAKPQQGHLKNLEQFRYLKEFKVSADEIEKVSVGNQISINSFKPGDLVKVTGTSKGKGFQGVVKRWGFHGSPASHGHKDQLRMPGSIGATGPAHVFKGTRMGGRTGGDQVTISNLEIVEVDEKNNEIFIKGAVPGARNNLILISADGEFMIQEVKAEEPKATKAEVKEEVKAEVAEVVEETKAEEKTEEVKEEVPVEEKVEEKTEEVKEEAKEEVK